MRKCLPIPKPGIAVVSVASLSVIDFFQFLLEHLLAFCSEAVGKHCSLLYTSYTWPEQNHIVSQNIHHHCQLVLQVLVEVEVYQDMQRRVMRRPLVSTCFKVVIFEFEYLATAILMLFYCYTYTSAHLMPFQCFQMPF